MCPGSGRALLSLLVPALGSVVSLRIHCEAPCLSLSAPTGFQAPHHPPEDTEATPCASSQAAEAKSTVARQVSEGKGEMLDGRAGRLPGGERPWWRLDIYFLTLRPAPASTPRRRPVDAVVSWWLGRRAQDFVGSWESGALSPGA